MQFRNPSIRQRTIPCTVPVGRSIKNEHDDDSRIADAQLYEKNGGVSESTHIESSRELL